MPWPLLLLFLALILRASSVTLTGESDGTLLRVREEEVASAFLANNETETVFLDMANPKKAAVLFASVLLDGTGGNVSVAVRGLFVGKTMLRAWRMESGNGSGIRELVAQLPVHTLRTTTGGQLSRAFSLLVAVGQFLNTFVMGLQLEWSILVQIFKRPIAPIIGFFCQFGLMPPIAFGWGSLFLEDPALHFGYFAVGCSPGGGASNAFTLLLRGNIDLSIAMTFISNITALGMMPAWIYSLGRVITNRIDDGKSGTTVHIPFKNMFASLAFLILPVFLGLLFKRWKPNLAAKSGTLAKITSFLMIIVVLPFGIYTNLYLFSLITWRTIVCGFCLPYTGFLVSFSIAKVLRRDTRDAKTIAIETMFQNAGIAIVLLQFSLPEPDKDLARVLPICVLLFTPLPLILLFIAQTIYDRIKARSGSSHSHNDPVTSQNTDTASNTAAKTAKNGKAEYQLEEVNGNRYNSQPSPADSGTGTISTSPSSNHLSHNPAFQPDTPPPSASPPPSTSPPPSPLQSTLEERKESGEVSEKPEPDDSGSDSWEGGKAEGKAENSPGSSPSPWKSRTLKLYSAPSEDSA